jgi:diacylglycerol kinase (ATP)
MTRGSAGRRGGLWQAILFALDGFVHAARTQRTFRIHLIIAGAVGVLVIWLPLGVAEAAVVVLAMAMVLVAELFNTGMEAMVDLLVERNHHDLAKLAKDIAAAAVLVATIAAAIVGVLILGPTLAVRVGFSPELAARMSRITVVVAVLAGIAGMARILRRPGPIQ